MSLTDKKSGTFFSPSPLYTFKCVNDDGTVQRLRYLYVKNTSNKNKKFNQKQKKKFGHTICKTFMQGNYVPYISLIGLHAETNVDKSQKYGGLDKDVAKKTIFFSLEGLW
jgi:hypothetical protein